jgi:hypothetical protein
MGEKFEVEVLFSAIFDAHKGVVPDSNPGWPYKGLFKKNSEFDTGLLMDLTLARIQSFEEVAAGMEFPSEEDFPAWIKEQAENPDKAFLPYLPHLGLLENLKDPYYLFPKSEPHSDSKIAEGRQRLIYGVSLVDQMVCRVLFSAVKELQPGWCTDSPSGIGISLDPHSEQLSSMLEGLRERGVTKAADASGYDFSISWLSRLSGFEIFRRIFGLEYGSPGHKIIILYFLVHLRHWLVTSDLHIYVMDFPGVQPSGEWVTSWINTFMRVHAAVYTGATAIRGKDLGIKAVGDDSAERLKLEPEEASRRYREMLGLVVKYPDIPEGWTLELCSSLFRIFPPTTTVFLPDKGVSVRFIKQSLNFDKMIVGLLCRRVLDWETAQAMQSVLDEFKYDESRFDRAVSILVGCGFIPALERALDLSAVVVEKGLENCPGS